MEGLEVSADSGLEHCHSFVDLTEVIICLEITQTSFDQILYQWEDIYQMEEHDKCKKERAKHSGRQNEKETLPRRLVVKQQPQGKSSAKTWG